MTIHRTNHDAENPYFMLNRASAEDNTLSYKALGILTYLMSKPDRWETRLSDLVSRHTDGREKVRSGLKELERAGYIVRGQSRGEDGLYSSGTVDVYEKPLTDNRITDNKTLVSNDLVVSNEEKKETPVLQDPMKRNIKQRNEYIDVSAYMEHAIGIGLSAKEFVALTDAVLTVCGTKTLVDNSESPDAVWKHNDAKDAALFLARLGYGTREEILDLAAEVREGNEWRSDPTPTSGDLKLFVSKRRDDDREAARDTYVQVKSTGEDCIQ